MDSMPHTHTHTLLFTFLVHRNDTSTYISSFTMQADGNNIKDMIFLDEYAGEVDYLEKRENNDCNSIMTLLMEADRSQSLVICPDK